MGNLFFIVSALIFLQSTQRRQLLSFFLTEMAGEEYELVLGLISHFLIKFLMSSSVMSFCL
jgi:hypothetical protein